MRAVPLSTRVRVRLTPGGGADRIDGLGRDSAGSAYIKARVRAAPEKGAANTALEALLAKALGVPKSRVRVARGATARVKTVAIDQLDAGALDSFLAKLPEI